MNEFDKARREILAALVVEYHRTEGELSDFEDLKARYALKSAPEWFDPIVSEIEHNLIVTRSMNEVAARIHPRGYGSILREVMGSLDADSLRVDAEKEEIVSDATNYEWFPVPDGWKWYQIEKDDLKAASGPFDAEAFDPAIFDTGDVVHSSDWTGISERLRRNPEAVTRIQQQIAQLDKEVDKLGLNNHERAKVKAITEGLAKLIQSPEPEWKAIVDLLRSPTLAAVLGLAGIIQLTLKLIFGIG